MLIQKYIKQAFVYMSAFSAKKYWGFIGVAPLLGVLFACLLLPAHPVHAATGINQQLNFQGRLLNTQGATVPDGNYNIQFKIYQDGDGLSVGDTTGAPAGSLKWTEDHINNVGNGVQVKNGYMSVQLGGITAFGGSIDWNQDTLWLSLNIGSTNGACTPFTSCTPDGEMVPMKRLSATPYALNAGLLGGVSSASFVQISKGLQTDAVNANSIYINKTGTGNIIDLQSGGTDSFIVTNTGDLTFGNNANHTISVTTAPASTAGKSLTLNSGAAGTGASALAGGDLIVSAGAGGGTNGSGGNVTIDAGAKNGSGANGNISIGTAGAATIQIGSTSLAVAQTINIGNNATASSSSAVNIGTGAAIANTVAIGGTGANTITIGDTQTGGSISIGAALTGGTLNIGGTGLQTSNVNIGNGTSNGGINIGNSSGTGSIVIGGNGARSITLGSNANNTIIVGNNQTGGSISIGAALTGGTLNFGSLGAQTSTITIGNGTSTGQIQIGNSTGTGQITLGGSTGARTITIGGSGANTIQLGNSQTGGSIGIGGALTAGTITIGNTGNASTTTIQSGTGAINLQTQGTGGINIGTNSVSQNVTIGSATGGSTTLQSSAGTTLSTVGTTNNATYLCRNSTNVISLCNTTGTGAAFVQAGNSFGAIGSVGTNDSFGLQIETGNVSRAFFDTSNTLYFGNANVTGGTNSAPAAFTLSGTGSSTTAVAGGALTIQGGNATVGNANGGNLILNGGTGFGTGVGGLVVISGTTYSTASAQSSASSTNVTQANVDSFGSVVLNATASNVNFTLGSPTLGAGAAGRLIYVTAANGSNDFTLRANVGGGTGVEQNIAMRQNTTATMIWNGSQWTAAGASSSTTLQSAYDNTLQSAGGAELVVSKTSATNGLTIRDSSVSPVNGTLLSVQTASAAGLLSVNGNVTEYANNAGAETAGGTTTTFPAGTWAALGAGAVSRNITTANIATGQGSVNVTTTAAANDGVKNTLNSTLIANNHYNVSFTAKLSSGTFTDMIVYYSIDGTANSVTCTSGQAVKTSVWTKVNCSITVPASGITSSNAIFIRQATGVLRTFYVDNLSVTIAADYNLATDGGVDDNTNFATNWNTAGQGTVAVTRNTADGNDASDSATAAISTSTANAGLRNKLSISPLTSTLYRVTVYAKLSASTFTDFKVRYSRDGSTTLGGNYVDCVDYNTQTITTTGWTQITCYITTDSTAPTSPYVYFVQTAAATRTYSVDTFSMTLATNTTPNVQIGSGVNGGPTTLLTLDKGSSAPIAANNDALLGSMYYDTTLGKLQCYEADGWGACGSSPDNIVTIAPEYNNAVLHGTGVGTMTSDLCSSTLHINDGTSSQPTICGTNETYNFYKWTSPQPTAQTYSIYVTYQLPTSFKTFTSGQTSLMGRTDSTNSTVQYGVYRNSSASGLTQCGSVVPVATGVLSTWQTGVATGAADPSTCGFAGGDSIVFKIDTIASSNANAYVGNLNFTFSNK